mmetsp:Transcript_9209/g.20539  ORF Transcript_9209/g.20539 Transcript_9209/m.20539 type:complete len:224 (+) Transcript_9209:715-1386(+)
MPGRPRALEVELREQLSSQQLHSALRQQRRLQLLTALHLLGLLWSLLHHRQGRQQLGLQSCGQLVANLSARRELGICWRSTGSLALAGVRSFRLVRLSSCSGIGCGGQKGGLCQLPLQCLHFSRQGLLALECRSELLVAAPGLLLGIAAAELLRYDLCLRRCGVLWWIASSLKAGSSISHCSLQGQTRFSKLGFAGLEFCSQLLLHSRRLQVIGEQGLELLHL